MKNSKAIAALPTVLILTLILVEISIGLVFVVYHLNWGEIELLKAKKALYYAEAGVNNILLKIDRDLSFSCVSSTISFGEEKEAEVTVIKDQPETGKDTIYSIGKYKGVRKKIKVIIQIDQETGKITIESWQEIKL